MQHQSSACRYSSPVTKLLMPFVSCCEPVIPLCLEFNALIAQLFKLEFRRLEHKNSTFEFGWSDALHTVQHTNRDGTLEKNIDTNNIIKYGCLSFLLKQCIWPSNGLFTWRLRHKHKGYSSKTMWPFERVWSEWKVLCIFKHYGCFSAAAR